MEKLKLMTIVDRLSQLQRGNSGPDCFGVALDLTSLRHKPVKQSDAVLFQLRPE